MHGTKARAPELFRGFGVLGRPGRDAPAGEGIPAGTARARRRPVGPRIRRKGGA